MLPIGNVLDQCAEREGNSRTHHADPGARRTRGALANVGTRLVSVLERSSARWANERFSRRRLFELTARQRVSSAAAFLRRRDHRREDAALSVRTPMARTKPHRGRSTRSRCISRSELRRAVRTMARDAARSLRSALRDVKCNGGRASVVKLALEVHADPFEHAGRCRVVGCNRNDERNAERIEPVLENGVRRFQRESLPPGCRQKGVADIDVIQPRAADQTAHSDRRLLAVTLDRVEAKAMLLVHCQRTLSQVTTGVGFSSHGLVSDEAQPVGIIQQLDDEGSIIEREPPDR